MGKHQNDKNANEIWVYFQMVIAWVKAMFITYRKEMKGIDWGILYNQYHDNDYDYDYDPCALEDEIVSLIDNE